jgi:hypothetical protein
MGVQKYHKQALQTKTKFAGHTNPIRIRFYLGLFTVLFHPSLAMSHPIPSCFFFVLMMAWSASAFSQQTGLCGVEVEEVKASTAFGYLIGYSVKFKNTKQQTVDHLIWSVAFEDNAGQLIEKDTGVFNSTELISPIQPGMSKTFLRTPSKIKGASRARIQVTRVHTISGETCKTP